MLKKLRKMLKKQEGFTLVELMIVVVILGILAGIGVQQYNKIQGKAERSVNQANLRMIESAVRMYQMLEGEDPIPEAGDGTVWDKLEGYGLDAKPTSPWSDGDYVVETGKEEEEEEGLLIIKNSSKNHNADDTIKIPSVQ